VEDLFVGASFIDASEMVQYSYRSSTFEGSATVVVFLTAGFLLAAVVVVTAARALGGASSPESSRAAKKLEDYNNKRGFP
jgi:hypothetical protein